MEYPVIRAKERPLVGKGNARKIRALGFIPAVMYGGSGEARPLVVDPRGVGLALNAKVSRSAVVRLEVEGGDKPESSLAVIREYSVHPVKRNLLHCDFVRVEEDTEMVFRFPIRMVGKSEAEKLGAKMRLVMRDAKFRCKIKDMMDIVEIDVTNMEVGQPLFLSKMPLPEGVKPVFTKDAAVVMLEMASAEKGEGEEEATPAAE